MTTASCPLKVDVLALRTYSSIRSKVSIVGTSALRLARFSRSPHQRCKRHVITALGSYFSWYAVRPTTPLCMTSDHRPFGVAPGRLFIADLARTSLFFQLDSLPHLAASISVASISILLRSHVGGSSIIMASTNITTISRSNLTNPTGAPAKITNFEHIASYTWCNETAPTISVPGRTYAPARPIHLLSLTVDRSSSPLVPSDDGSLPGTRFWHRLY